MATISVQHIPDELHQRIRDLAVHGCRSLEDEVVHLLDKAVKDLEDNQRRLDALDNLCRNQFTLPDGFPESQDLIRQDRDR